MALQNSSLHATSAIAILVDTPSGQRFFHSFGKAGSIQTAWSLAGAKLFLVTAHDDISKVTERLTNKKKKFTFHNVSFSSSPLSLEVLK
ncbi:hypothetical protein [Vibrio vulnificus]|uniref:Uncharacterized protein n=1 Tax=Vibrio vulnificus TaxID=672 RepID=A0AAN1PP24_VIBVL|nr:hypothetical protein [Vibrio vulnificus]AXX59854.1 hypothetical protein FORC53_1515 [Vibrio vulnificus]